MTQQTNTTTIRLIKHIVAVVGNIIKNIINIDYKAIVKVFMEVHFKIIAKKNIIFVKSQITNQLSIFLINKRRYITSFIKIQKMSKIIKSLQFTSKAF